MRRQCAHFLQPTFGDGAGVVRMYAGRGVEFGRLVVHTRLPAFLRQRQCRVAGRHAGARDDQRFHAGRPGAPQHVVAVVVEGVVGEVDADVDHGGATVLSCGASTGGSSPANRA